MTASNTDPADAAADAANFGPAPTPPPLEWLATLRVNVAAPIEVGQTGAGQRRVIPIIGGTIQGPRVRGRVLAGGADFQVVSAAGVATLDARYVLELDDGQRIYVVNHAIRRAAPEVTARLMRGEPVDPSQVYFRCWPSFEVPAGPWSWLGERLCVGSGQRHPDRVDITIFAVQ